MNRKLFFQIGACCLASVLGTVTSPVAPWSPASLWLGLLPGPRVSSRESPLSLSRVPECSSLTKPTTQGHQLSGPVTPRGLGVTFVPVSFHVKPPRPLIPDPCSLSGTLNWQGLSQSRLGKAAHRVPPTPVWRQDPGVGGQCVGDTGAADAKLPQQEERCVPGTSCQHCPF